MIKKLALFFGVLLGSIGFVEWNARQNPPTRWQRVAQFQLLDSVPIWTSGAADEVAVNNVDCVSESGADVVLLGDSILYGVKLDPDDTLGPRLSRSLKRPDDTPACVVNLSVPGFTLEQELAVFKQRWDELTPAIVVLEIWHNTPHRAVNAGEKVYNFGHLKVDDAGIPNPFGVPSALNHLLFGRSALWRRTTEGFATDRLKSDVLWKDAVSEIAAFHEWLQKRDSRLVLTYATKLKDPWSAGRELEDKIYKQVRDWADQTHVPSVWFKDVLATRHVEDIRLDTCCHLNKDGMILLSDGLTQRLQPLLNEPTQKNARIEP